MEQKLELVRSLTLQEQVYGRLREGLLKGHFVPGDTLKIRALAEMLGTSEMPVREALQRLVSERALSQRPNRSISVPILTRRARDELLIIRTEVEGLAAACAAENLTLDDADALDQLNRRMEAAVEVGDFGLWREINYDFHFAVYRGSGLPRLVEIIDSLWLQFGPTLADAFRSDADPTSMIIRSRGLHNDVVNAIRNSDREGARKAIAGDLREFLSWYHQTMVE